MRFENYSMQVHKIIANTLINKIQNESLKTITISDITVSPDRQNVIVYINSKYKKNNVNKLNHIKGIFRNQIAKHIQSKHTPHINFESDDLPEKIVEIEKTLNKAAKNRPKNLFNVNNYKKDV